MANVNLIPSNDISITQSEDNIYLRVSKDNAVSTSSTKCVENQAITNYVNTKVLDVYSTNEIRIGTWVDNKPIYRKVFEVEGFNQLKTIATGLGDVIDKVIDIRGLITWEGNQVPNNFINTSANNISVSLYYNNNGNILLTNGLGSTCNSGFVIIEYTKTTD